MPSAASLPHPADPAGQQAEDALYYRRVLHGLIDMGADLARAVHRQALLPAGGEKPGAEPSAMSVSDAVAAFDRISRAIRRTVALARKVAEPLPAGPAVSRSDQHRAAARTRVIREVEDVIQREAEGADVETLEAELRERLDAPDLDDEIDDRPVADVVADICRDLGLAAMPGTHPRKRRTPEDVAALCARAAQPRTAPFPVVAHPAPGRAEAGIAPPLLPRDAGADLLRFTFPVRGT